MTIPLSRLTFRRLRGVGCLLLAVSTLAGAADTGVETHRIRFTNVMGGLVEVSADQGDSWLAVGKVTRPAHCLAEGFAASRWAEDGTVAVTAVHGLRIRVRPTQDGQRGALLSVVPKEFHSPPPNYGGHIPGASGIYTDIPAGTSIFRNLAPFVGNPVFVQYRSGLVPIPRDYEPVPQDRIVIVVKRPRELPSSIEIENWAGGKVTLRYGSGTELNIAQVQRPVWGVGRFDATGYTGIGCINTNHAGVITISTAPDVNGQPQFDDPFGETRGGFMIQPNRHAENEGYPVYQAMVVAPLSEDAPPLEGRPPLFDGYLGLQFQSRDLSRSYVCQMRVDGGDWESLPERVGIDSRLFTRYGIASYFRSRGEPREVTQGVTHLRIRFPQLDYEAHGRQFGRRVSDALCPWPADCYTCSSTLS